jgi:hypothetical protein
VIAPSTDELAGHERVLERVRKASGGKAIFH